MLPEKASAVISADWLMGDENFKKDENYWPIRPLKSLARFPHEYQTWLWSQHTISNGNPAEPYASNTKMDGVILLPPVSFEQGFWKLEINTDKTIYFHSPIPLHPDEMNLKLKKEQRGFSMVLRHTE